MKTLRFRKGGFIGTFIAMFFGTVMVMACGGLMESGITTAVPPQRLAAAPVVVTAEVDFDLAKQNPGDAEEDPEIGTLPERAPLDANLVGTISGIQGVRKAVPDVSFPATLVKDGMPVGPGTTSLGHGWASAELTPFTLSEGAQPSGAGQVVLEQQLASMAGVKPGDTVQVAVRGKTETFTVSGIAAPTGTLTTSALFFSDDRAQQFSGGRIDSIGVLAADGVDAKTLRDRVAGKLDKSKAVALIGDDRGVAEFPEAAISSENLIILSAVFGGFALMVAMFVVASTLGLSIQQRMREMAMLRAIGTTPRQLRRMIISETMVVSVVAIAAALFPGVIFGEWLFDQFTANGVVPKVVEFHSGLVPFAAAGGIALLTAWASARVASKRAANTRPTEALAEAAIQTKWLTWTRVLFSVICLAGGTVLMVITATMMTGPIAQSTAGPTVMLWAIGLALIFPGITKVMTAIFQWPLRALSGLSGSIAILNSKARSIPVAAAITPIMLATGIAIGNLYLQTTNIAAAEKAYTENLRADAVITTSTGGIAPELVDQVRTVPGVAGASAFVTSNTWVEAPYDTTQSNDGFPVQGVTADGVGQTTAITPTAGELTALRGNTMALPTEHARKIGKNVGDTMTMRLGDGAKLDMKIVATFDPRPGFEMILMPAELIAAHTTEGLASQILVRAAPGTDIGALTAALGTLTADKPGVIVADRNVLTETYSEQQQTQAWINYLLVGMIVAYTALAVVNTLVMATAARRREFGLQRLTGFTRGQVMRMMAVEAALIALVGIVIGTAISATSLVPFSIVVSDTPWPSGPIWIYLAVIGVAGALAFLSTLLPAWAAMRQKPVETVAGAE
ncbi:FtsX-like permease family protein [Herbihabitans rhizosphaerae]|nr:FtsX-like permease family protein [Herbihabitans rhizosphaerae]